jgi:SAM-dependent methyltransferase
VPVGITAWEFARGKLRGDPLYRAILAPGLLPSGGTLVDVGCGQGLALALLAEAADAWRSGRSGLPGAPPIFDAMLGMELRPRVADMARRALGARATIVSGDARTNLPRHCRAVLFFDVLHMMPASDQARLLRAGREALEPDGIVLVREADAASGWRFQAVRFGNRLKALVFGHWRQTFHFRTAAEWTRCFEEAGFAAEARNTSEGTPFGNVLFVLTPRAPAPA